MTWSDAPQEPAAPTRVGRARALEVDSEPTIPLAVPDVGERLSERVTQDQRLIIPTNPRGVEPRGNVPVGGTVAKGPGPLPPGQCPRARRSPVGPPERRGQPQGGGSRPGRRREP